MFSSLNHLFKSAILEKFLNYAILSIVLFELVKHFINKRVVEAQQNFYLLHIIYNLKLL